ncbi:TlpA disulfide reductase family protein [Haloferula rosea]|uniref:Redoxin domain-containing protein n=1 Tax=Haloferula rosea TaxID=490093 RepID=A0A934VE57_9BACT|nr:TlpA disulfide reductase family protein [Haloferula rosea]MBK1825706.1 redoxin domain-containing protein [Haloferula rosea]
MIRYFSLATVSICMAFSPSVASAALEVGDPAPRIAPGKWAQGEPVKELEGDKVYIVEFWATWCGPCITAIPHIDALSREFASDGLVVVGQNLGEDAAKVDQFVRKMGSKMSYRVGVDDAAGTMAKTWLKAAGQNGIPCAFVVNKQGKLAYIGHPMSLEKSFLKKLLAEPGTKPKTADKAAPATLSDEAKALATKASALLAEGKPEEAAPVVAALHEALPDGFRHIGGLMELDLMIARKQYDDSVALAGILAEDFEEKPTVVIAVANSLAQAPAATPAMLDAAAALAQPLSSSAAPVKADALGVLALVAFRKDEPDKAVRLQTQAVESAAPSQTPAMKAALKAYQEGRLP